MILQFGIDRTMMGKSAIAERSNEWRLFAALSLGFSGAAVAPFILPVIGASLIQTYGITVSGLGYVLAIELAAIAIGSFAVFPLFRTRDPRLLIAATMVVIAVGNVLCLGPTSATFLIALRAVIGIAEGTAQAAIVGMAARMQRPDRAFGVIVTVEAVAITIAFLTLPAITELWGPKGSIMMLAVFAALGLLFAPLVGANARGEGGTLPEPAKWTLMFTLVLVCWFLFQAGQNAIWAYAEIFAERAGLTFAQANMIYAVSSICTIFAAMLAGWLEARFRLSVLLIIAILLSAVSILGFPRASGITGYGLTAIVFNAALFLAFPLIGTLASNVDGTGRLATLLPAAQAAGLTGGPALASVTLGQTGSYTLIGVFASAATLIGLLAIVPAFNSARSADQAAQ